MTTIRARAGADELMSFRQRQTPGQPTSSQRASPPTALPFFYFLPTHPRRTLAEESETKKLESGEEKPRGRRELTAPMKMETRAGKRPGDRDEGKRRTRARAAAEERDRSVTDEEVEEFFAILRRLREAPRCFPIRDGSGGSGGVRRRVAAEEWWPRFEREDFEEESSARDDGWGSRSEEAASGGEVAAEERVAENAILGRLDLNAEPAPEGPGPGRPGVGSTTPVAP